MSLSLYVGVGIVVSDGSIDGSQATIVRRREALLYLLSSRAISTAALSFRSHFGPSARAE